MSLDRLLEHAEQFEKRQIQDILNEACAGYWRRRAEQFASVGTSACDEIAEACRNRARVAELGGDL